MLIYEHSRPGRKGAPQAPISKADLSDIPQHLLRQDLSLIHISEPTRPPSTSRMPSSA